MKAVVATFNQEKALVGAFSVITNLRMELFEALHRVTSNMSHRVAWSRSLEEDWCHEARNNVCDVSRVMCDV